MKLSKSQVLISLVLAALADNRTLAAVQPSGDPFNITFSVSKSGWRNLRKIDSSFKDIPVEYWYVCGARKILGFSKKQAIEDDYELLARPPNEEFQGEGYFTRELKEFVDNGNEKARFISSAQSACSLLPDPELPELINMGFSSQKRRTDFYYLLPRDFKVTGSIRSFWVNGHSARQDKMRIRAESDLAKKGLEQGIDFGEWLTGVDTWWVSETRSSVARYEINCSSNEIRGLSYTKYEDDGSPNYSDNALEKFEPIIPETIAESWRELVCLIK